VQHCGDLLIKGHGSHVDNVINSEVERRLGAAGLPGRVISTSSVERAQANLAQ
jgi:hypothetical protein